MTDYQKAFQQWQELTTNIRRRAKAIDDSIHQRGWDLAATVEIPHCRCCLHNASIDDNLNGWCFRNPERLKVAKQAAHLVDQWPGSRLADRLIQRAWNRLIAKPFGYCAYTLD